MPGSRGDARLRGGAGAGAGGGRDGSAPAPATTLTSPTSPAQLDGTWRLFQMTSSAGVHNEDLAAGRFNW